ncbi:MAG: proprotein convertase P-domain-containing protein, partial [Bacteroidota bacterium]
VQGNWSLRITDNANIDEGVFNSWKLALGLSKATVVEKTEAPGLRIPDNDSLGIDRDLEVVESGTVKEIEIDIDLTHTYIGDLSLHITSPQGTQIGLHSRTGGSANNLIKKYSLLNTPELNTLKGENISGNWKLHIDDRADVDTGKLNQWGIKIILE